MAQLLTYEDVQATLSQLSSTSGVSLRPGLGVFLERPRLWDPEAEGWRILVDVNPLSDIQQNRLEDAVRGAGLRWRRTSRGGLKLIEIHAPARASSFSNEVGLVFTPSAYMRDG